MARFWTCTVPTFMLFSCRAHVILQQYFEYLGVCTGSVFGQAFVDARVLWADSTTACDVCSERIYFLYTNLPAV